MALEEREGEIKESSLREEDDSPAGEGDDEWTAGGGAAGPASRPLNGDGHCEVREGSVCRGHRRETVVLKVLFRARDNAANDDFVVLHTNRGCFSAPLQVVGCLRMDSIETHTYTHKYSDTQYLLRQLHLID